MSSFCTMPKSFFAARCWHWTERWGYAAKRRSHSQFGYLVKMDQLLSIDFDNMRAVVQPGHVNLMLTKKIAKNGWYYAPDPSSQSSCTIGGNLAENAGGSHCRKYGVTTNHIVAAEVVLPTGEIVQIGSEFGDAVGYDLIGLLFGSEGTLGIATAITVKILINPETVKTIMATYDRVEDASDTVSSVIGKGIIPAAMEMMDQLAMQSGHSGGVAGRWLLVRWAAFLLTISFRTA